MDDEDKKIVAEAIAEELQDSCGIETEADRDLTARCIVDRIEHLLHQRGWMPPETYDRVHGWAARTANIPDHHVNRDVLTSHLAELAQILHDR